MNNVRSLIMLCHEGSATWGFVKPDAFIREQAERGVHADKPQATVIMRANPDPENLRLGVGNLFIGIVYAQDAEERERHGPSDGHAKKVTS
jgi:hypothetical protein